MRKKIDPWKLAGQMMERVRLDEQENKNRIECLKLLYQNKIEEACLLFGTTMVDDMIKRLTSLNY